MDKDLAKVLTQVPTVPGLEKLEAEAVFLLTDGLIETGEPITQDHLECLVRAAFRGGVVAMHEKLKGTR